MARWEPGREDATNGAKGIAASRHRYGAIGRYERTLRTGLLALRTEQGRYERSFFPPRPHQDRAISPKGQDITESCAVGALVEVVQEQSKHGVT